MLTLFNKYHLDIDLHLRAILNLNPFVNKGPDWLLEVKDLFFVFYSLLKEICYISYLQQGIFYNVKLVNLIQTETRVLSEPTKAIKPLSAATFSRGVFWGKEKHNSLFTSVKISIPLPMVFYCW